MTSRSAEDALLTPFRHLAPWKTPYSCPSDALLRRRHPSYTCWGARLNLRVLGINPIADQFFNILQIKHCGFRRDCWHPSACTKKPPTPTSRSTLPPTKIPRCQYIHKSYKFSKCNMLPYSDIIVQASNNNVNPNTIFENISTFEPFISKH